MGKFHTRITPDTRFKAPHSQTSKETVYDYLFDDVRGLFEIQFDAVSAVRLPSIFADPVFVDLVSVFVSPLPRVDRRIGAHRTSQLFPVADTRRIQVATLCVSE